VCGARVKPFLQRDLRDFLFVEEEKQRGEFFLVCELGFRIFFSREEFYRRKRVKERKREKKREASRKSLYLLPITRRCT